MRKRDVKKQVWLSKEEAKIFSNKAVITGLSESELFRFLILGYEPREKPDDRFYEVMKQLRIFGINLNQIAHRANTYNHIDKELYIKEAEKWNRFMEMVKNEYLRPKKNQ